MECYTARAKGIIMQSSLLGQFLTCLFWIITVLTACYFVVFAIRLFDDIRSAFSRIKQKLFGYRR